LQTARNINGVSFNGSADITVTVAAGTLTGSTLASGVTASSLTSVGTISSGTWSGSFGAVSGANLTNITGANVTGTVANATNATAVPWTGVSGRPTAVSSFTNDSGYLTSVAASALTGSTLASGVTASSLTSVGTLTTLTIAGTSAVSAFKTPNIKEVATVSATAASGTIQYDITTQSVLYYTSNASGNWTVNFRGSSGTSLNTLMQTGESISASFLATQGATAYYNSAVTIDGNSVTPKWQGGTAPTSGNTSSIDSYTYVIIKTGNAAFTVLASVTKYA
jgi:hypothetical protein